jgi:hypothetical protein
MQFGEERERRAAGGGPTGGLKLFISAGGAGPFLTLSVASTAAFDSISSRAISTPPYTAAA